MSATGRGAVRAANDFYETPRTAIEAFLPHVSRTESWLDAGCGNGAIGLVLQAHGLTIQGVELDDERASVARTRGLHTTTGDFLSQKWLVGGVIMNPPFSFAEDFVRHALACVGANGRVYALLRLAFLEGQKRASFHREFACDVFVLSRRPSFTRGGTDSAAYAWFAWGLGHGGRLRIL